MTILKYLYSSKDENTSSLRFLENQLVDELDKLLRISKPNDKVMLIYDTLIDPLSFLGVDQVKFIAKNLLTEYKNKKKVLIKNPTTTVTI